MKRTVRFALSLAASLALSLTSTARAENWPQWRGPSFNGSSPDTGLPAQWNEGTNVLWSTPLPGYAGSTPVIWDDTIFLTTPDAQKNLLLYCLNRKDGSVRWQKEVGVGDRVAGKNNMCAPSPATDGQRVIVMFGTGDLAAFDFNGRELWKRNLGRDYGKFAIMWIYGSSPVLFEGKLFVQVMQRDNPKEYPHAIDDKPERDSYLLALDPVTGKTLWRHVRTTDAAKECQEAYTTPLPFHGPKGPEVVLVGGDFVTSHHPATGEEIWRSAGLNPRQTTLQKSWFRTVTTAVAAENQIVACGPRGEPVIAIKAGGQGNVTESHRAWTCNQVTSDWSTPLYYRSRLFVLNGDKRVMVCVDPKTGQEKWSGSLGVKEQVWSSPTGADGKIYCLSENGTVIVLEAGDEFKILATNSLGDENPSRSSVVVASGQLFIRTAKKIYAVGGGKK